MTLVRDATVCVNGPARYYTVHVVVRRVPLVAIASMYEIAKAFKRVEDWSERRWSKVGDQKLSVTTCVESEGIN